MEGTLWTYYINVTSIFCYMHWYNIVELGQGQTMWAQDLKGSKMVHAVTNDVSDDTIIGWNMKVLTPRVSSVYSP
eukprot:4386084-Ditylum_brightwellii.AAC.1